MVEFDLEANRWLVLRTRPVAKDQTAVLDEDEVAARGVVKISEHDRARDERDGDGIELDLCRVFEVEASQDVRENDALNARMVENQVENPDDREQVDDDEERNLLSMRVEVVDDFVGDHFQRRRRRRDENRVREIERVIVSDGKARASEQFQCHRCELVVQCDAEAH